VGRGTGLYGEEIHLTHRYAVAFTVEMDYDIMGTAPDAPVVLESARKYVDGAVIAIQLANFSRRLGYPARAHIDGNYRVIAPLVARDAGLGEIGRMGILMIPELGPRVRLGVVTTDLPLLPDQRFDGRAMIDFCSNCRKCAVNCPSNAIPLGDRDVVDGSLQWKLDEMKCFQYWNIIGTDCALCMTVCPYSHPNNRMHNFARSLIERSYFARRAALVLDDFLFGKKPTARQGPEWLPNEAS
jgi:ferredoxin